MKCSTFGSSFSVRSPCQAVRISVRNTRKLLSGRCQRSSTARAESASGKKDDSKQDSDPSWTAKFFAGSDEDEPQWEKEPTSIKDKVLEALEREKERSKFWGRLAVLALGAVLLSERISGKGIVTALNMATGVPVMEIEPALGVLVVAILAVGLVPAFKKSDKTSDQPPSTLDSFQVVTGRVACVALAGTIFAEAVTGKGILGLLNINTGVEITEIEGALTFILLLLFTADAAQENDQTKG